MYLLDSAVYRKPCLFDLAIYDKHAELGGGGILWLLHPRAQATWFHLFSCLPLLHSLVAPRQGLGTQAMEGCGRSGLNLVYRRQLFNVRLKFIISLTERSTPTILWGRYITDEQTHSGLETCSLLHSYTAITGVSFEPWLQSQQPFLWVWVWSQLKNLAINK